MHYSPRVVSEHVPDLTTLPRMLAHPRFRGKTGQDLAIALWELMVDRELGLFHYLPARETFREGQDVYDPLQVWNVFGFTICHCHAHILGVMGRAAGFATRIATVIGHEGTEFHYDGGWHYFDGDIQQFHRRHPPRQAEIASREDTFRDLSLVDGQANPSRPYGFPDRLPAAMRRLHDTPPHYHPVLEERLHSMDYRLRPGESLRRYFRPLGRWQPFDTYPELFARYCGCRDDDGPRETGPEGPSERFWPWRRYGNGVFHYAPRLGRAWQDAELGFDRRDGVAEVDDGLEAVAPDALLEIPFESPYLIAGVPDPLNRVPPALGAELTAAFVLPPGASATITAVPYDPSRRGERPATEIWRSTAPGQVTAKVDYTPAVAGAYAFRLQVRLAGVGARLTALENHLWVMLSPHALPALRQAGPNRMQLAHGDEYGLPSRAFRCERWFDGRPGDPVPGAFSSENLDFRPDTYARLVPADPSRPWRLVLELTAPPDWRLHWADLFTLHEGVRPTDVYDGTPCTVECAGSPDGPWTLAASGVAEPHEQGWHTPLHARLRFPGDAARGYVRLSAKRGLSLVRINAHAVPPAAALAQGPLEIEHAWTEDDPREGRRWRRHHAVVTEESLDYTVSCAGTPHNDWIHLRVPSRPR